VAHARGLANRKGRTHDLGKMSLPDLVKAYFLYPAVITYLALSAICIVVIGYTAQSIWPLIAAAALATLVYPLVWYCLHRFVLHGSFLYKSPLTASTWKRIHYDHHQDPNDLRVLFGALYTTLPTIAGVTLPLGWLIGGLPGAAAAFASGLLTTCFYEYCHCVQHLKYLPKSRFLRRIKQLHMAHHFHNEHGNYGITNFAWDRVFGTLYQGPKDMARSPTVFNLGYDAEQAKRYPWVAEISERRGHFKAKPEDRTTPPAEHNPAS